MKGRGPIEVQVNRSRQEQKSNSEPVDHVESQIKILVIYFAARC